MVKGGEHLSICCQVQIENITALNYFGLSKLTLETSTLLLSNLIILIDGHGIMNYMLICMSGIQLLD